MLAASILTGAPSAKAAGPEVFLLVVPTSGPLEQLGRSAVQGAELALKTLGGGYRLEIIDEAAGPKKDLDLNQVAVVTGYFTESRFQEDAAGYLYFKKPVLLPFLTEAEAAGRGPATFFRLMPTFKEQGQFMAMEILNMKKRPRRILIVRGVGEAQTALASAFESTLAAPIQPPPPPPAEKGQKAPKAPTPIKPIDPKQTTVVVLDLEQAQGNLEVKELGKDGPDLIILALNRNEALRLAPVLTASKYRKKAMWGGTMLGLREVGAAFATLEMNLHLSLPVANPADPKNKPVQEFRQRYVAAYQAHPTWISALAYDSLTLAIKAASTGDTPEEMLAFIAGQTHHSLGKYDLSPGGGGTPPLAFMPVRQETLGFLP